MRTDIEIRGVRDTLFLTEKFRRYYPRTVVRGAKRGLSKVATKVRGDVRGTPIGGHIVRSAWGKEKRNRLTARVKVIQPRLGDDRNIKLAVGLYGYAAVLEDGGRIVAHTVRGKPHPGAQVPAYRFGQATMRSNQGEVARAIDAEVGKLIRSVNVL